MKRPLMIIGFSLFVSLAVFSYFRTVALVSIAITFAVISVALLFLAKNLKLHNVVLVFLGALIASLLLIFSDFIYLRPAEKFDGTQIKAEGYVKRIDNASLILKCKIHGKYCNVYVKDSSRSTIRLGDKFELTGKVIDTDSLDSNYMRSKCRAYSCVLYAENVDIVYKNDIVAQYPFEDTIFKFKNHLLDIQDEIFSDFSYGFIKAVTLGDKRDVPDDIAGSFKRAGLSHVLVISGLHLSIISGAVFVLLRRLGIRKAALVTIFVTLFYMALTGFAPSVTRAGIMNIIMYFAVVLRQDYDGITSISLACLVMCLLNPYCAADISLQLSVVSTTGILAILPPMRKLIWEALGKSTRIRRVIMKLSDILIVTLAANVALMPFYVFMFGTISLVSPLSNIVASLLMPIIISFSLIATLIGALPFVSGAACIPAFVADISVLTLVKSTDWFAGFRFASVSTKYTFVVIWLIATCALMGYAFYTKKSKVKIHAAILSIIILFAAIFCYNINNGSKISVKALPTYTNGCVVISYKSHNTVIYRSSRDEKNYYIENVLSGADIYDIDTLIVPAYEDCSEVLNLITEYDVKTLIIDNRKPDTTLERKLREYNIEVFSITQNREVDIGNKVTVSFDYENGVRSILLNADGVMFCIPYNEIDMLEDFSFYKETDVILLSKDLPYGLSYMNLSYIVFTNYETQDDMYRNTAYLTDRFAFTDNNTEFMIEDANFYVTEEWGSLW